MFESASLAAPRDTPRRSLSLTAAVAIHAAAVLAVVGASLGRVEELAPPSLRVTSVSFAAPPPLASKSGGARSGSPARATPLEHPAPRELPRLDLAPAPFTAADSAPSERPPDAAGAGFGDGVPGGSGDTPRSADEGGSGDAPLVPGGGVRAQFLLHRVEIEYPETARKAGIQGIVIFEAIIATDGGVEEIRTLRAASPLLEEAARRGGERPRASCYHRAG